MHPFTIRTHFIPIVVGLVCLCQTFVLFRLNQQMTVALEMSSVRLKSEFSALNSQQITNSSQKSVTGPIVRVEDNSKNLPGDTMLPLGESNSSQKSTNGPTIKAAKLSAIMMNNGNTTFPPGEYNSSQKSIKNGLIVRADELSKMTYGHATLAPGQENLFLYDIPKGVKREHLWRYRSNGIFWNNLDDPLYRNFHQQIMEMKLRQGQASILPEVVQNQHKDVALKLVNAGLNRLALLWTNAYPFTLEQTTFPLADGTTYIITGDIELMWHRDSCAQVNHYLPLLATIPSPNPLEALVEGLIRRQSLFISVDPYATSFRLFLDFNFVGKSALTDWDYKSGRTIHVAMHNYELDNLAYHLKLSARFHRFSRSMRPFDETWLKGLDKIMDTVEREQNHMASPYTYPELKNNGRGSPVCNGHGLTWCSHRPSDDATQMGYLIPSNMMMVMSLRNAAKIVRDVNGGEDRATRADNLAESIDEGIHKHAVVSQEGFGKVYAYEVDGCGHAVMMDDANIPSLLSIPYLEYTSPHDPENVLRENTRRFVLSTKNPYFFDGGNGNMGIGSPHTPKGNIWHLAIIMQALTSTEDVELRYLLDMLSRTATNDLMHESFRVIKPTQFTRRSFAWANSLFAELISSRLDDIIRVTRVTNPPSVSIPARKWNGNFTRPEGLSRDHNDQLIYKQNQVAETDGQRFENKNAALKVRGGRKEQGNQERKEER